VLLSTGTTQAVSFWAEQVTTKAKAAIVKMNFMCGIKANIPPKIV
jgi:hypothetical protein